MAGMMDDKFKEEVVAELSWMMNVIEDLCEKIGMETYETVLLKHRVQMEEEKALDQFFFFHYKVLDTLTISEIQKKIAQSYKEATKREWTLSDELVQKLIQLKREQVER